MNLALDRIQGISEAAGVPFRDDPSFDPEAWFSDIVGVTKTETDKPEKVVFQASPGEAPYIETKPLHPSQKILERRFDGTVVFELNVIVNRELIRLFIGFAEGIKVIAPRKLAFTLRTHFRKSLERYERL